MSRIGQAIIKIPDGIEVKHEGNKFWAKGSKGELTAPVSEIVNVTIKDKIAGRGQKKQESTIKKAAKILNLKIFTPENLEDLNFIKNVFYKKKNFLI